MKTFGTKNKFGKRGSARSEERSFGKPHGSSRFGRRDTPSSSRGPSLESFEATCDKCGKKCDLPFKPTGNKPVYCKSCFRDVGSSTESRGRSNFDRSPSRPSFERFEAPVHSNPSSDDLDKINKKLDKIMRALKIDWKE